MDWKVLLPTVGRVLGGPLAGMAVEAVGKAIGISEPTSAKVQDALDGNTLTDAQIVALRETDAQLKMRMRELDIDLEKLATQDRDSARAMQAKLNSRVPAVLALVITTGFFGVLAGLLTGHFDLWDNAGITMLIGSLATSWGMVVSFYYGSAANIGGRPQEKK
jgi:FtsZ-binding cell division protein ZapB